MPDSLTVPEDRKARIFNPKSSLFPFKREIKLTEEQSAAIIKDLDEIYRAWDDGVGPLRSQLMRWVNNSEGISEPTDSPWPDSSSIYKPITETRINIVHSFWMSIIRPRIGRLFKCVTDRPWDKEESQLAVDLESYFNNHRQFNLMYLKSTSESFTANMRDGTVGRSLDWDKKVEKRWEVVRYDSPEKFIQKNPTPESIGISVDQYTKIMERLQSGEMVSLDEDFDVVTRDMPIIDTEEIKDVVVYPLTVSRQERTRFLGKRFWLRKSELRQREKDGIYHNVDKVLEHDPTEERDQVSVFQDSVEGVNQSEKKSDYLIIQGRYFYDYDGDGIEEKLLVTYAPESKTLLLHDKYPFYHGNDFIKLSRFKIRPKRLLGRGICQMLDDLNQEANIQSRFRVNSMLLTHAPMFKAVDTLKSALDPRRVENRIRPGGIWYLPKANFNDVAEVEMGRKNYMDNFREEALINQNADNILGASELRSGRETPNDPRAPAQKTALLLQQSSTRLDDFIFNAILTENEVLDDVLKLYYQFGPDQLKTAVQVSPDVTQMGGTPVSFEQGGGYIEKVIERSKLNRDTLHLQLSITSLLDNPDYLRQAWEEMFMKYGPEPMIGNILEVRWEILNNIWQNFPPATGKKILLPLQEILQKQPKVPPVAMGAEGNGKLNPVAPAGVK